MSLSIRKEILISQADKNIDAVELKRLKNTDEWCIYLNHQRSCEHTTTKSKFLKWITKCAVKNSDSNYVIPLERLCKKCHKIKMKLHPGYYPEYLNNCFQFDIKVGKALAHGKNGTVHEILDQPNLVVKIIPIFENPEKGERRSRKDFINEVSFAYLMGTAEVGPSVHASWICDEAKFSEFFQQMKDDSFWSIPNLKNATSYGFIISERMQITLFQLKNMPNYTYDSKNYNIMKTYVTKFLRNASNLGYILNDTHTNNIMVNLDNNQTIMDARIVDFGDYTSLSMNVEDLWYIRELLPNNAYPEVQEVIDRIKLQLLVNRSKYDTSFQYMAGSIAPKRVY